MQRKALVPILVGVVLASTFAIGASALALNQHSSSGARLQATVSAAVASNPGGTQATALEDGRVSREELDEAVAAEAACLRDRGIEANVVAGSGRNPSSVTFVLPSLENIQQVEDHLAACKAANSAALSAVWLEQSRPTDAEAAEARRFVAQCVSAHEGKITTTNPSDTDISKWMDSSDPITRIAAGRCIEDRYRVFGF